MKDANGFVPEGVTLELLAADLEAEYLGELDPNYRRPSRLSTLTRDSPIFSNVSRWPCGWLAADTARGDVGPEYASKDDHPRGAEGDGSATWDDGTAG